MKTKLLQVLPPTYLFFSILVMLLLHLIAPVFELINYPWNLLGVVPLLTGVSFNLIADAAFKKAKTTVKPFETSSALITDGVFRFSRHPMYFGMVLILLGMAIFMGSITPFIIVAVFTVLMEFVFVKTEENMLAQQFGSAWQDYRKKVRKWL